MKIVTTVEAFVSALKLSVKPEKNSPIPVLTNVLLDGVSIISTTLDLWSVVPLDGKRTGKGRFLVPYHQALSVLTGESGPLTIEHKADKKGDGGEVRLILTECEFTFNSPTAVNFPKVPEIAETTLTLFGNDFRQLIDRTLFALSREESRYTLNGSLFLTDKDVVRMVATDGHRLSVSETPNKKGALEQTMIRRAALDYLRLHVNGSVSIGVKDEWQAFRTHGLIFLSRKMTGQFPDYMAVMPNKSKITATIPAANKLHPILARVAKCADERSGAVKFSFGDSLVLSADSTDRGFAKATFPATTNGEIVMKMNSGYILEYLKQCGDVEITAKFTDAQSAVIFTIDNWTYLVMPMRM